MTDVIFLYSFFLVCVFKYTMFSQDLTGIHYTHEFIILLIASVNLLSTIISFTSSGFGILDPNPALQNNFGGRDRPNSNNFSNQSSPATGRDDGKKRKPTTSSGYGSNVHTLKRDEDDGRFNDRNSYWNGNSTQYGGNNDGK